MVETVALDGIVVEPGAVTGLPFLAAEHAELSGAAARGVLAHMHGS